MNYIISGANVFHRGKFSVSDVLVRDGVIADISASLPGIPGVSVFNMNGCFIFPGLSDVHVHLREPGFSYKETVSTGTAAASAGGFTSVCAMPNLEPVPDCTENLKAELEIIGRDALVHVCPYGAVTRSEKGAELSDMEALAPYVTAFSDDGRGVQSPEMMEAAMKKCASLGKLIAAHCEDNSLLNGGYIHAGAYAAAHGHRGIVSESEWRPIARDIELAAKTGCAYHVCHVSTKESVDIIRKAKARGINVTCETAPHYLLLTEDDLQEDGRFKMNPPLRESADRDALIEGLLDGTVDMIVTDHAPHSAEEKSKGLEKSAMGVVGLETSFPLMYTHFVKTGIITLEKLLDLMHGAPMRRFNVGTELEIGAPADFTVFALEEKYTIDPEGFLSKGRATPFEGWEVFGRCIMTAVNGRIVYDSGKM